MKIINFKKSFLRFAVFLYAISNSCLFGQTSLWKDQNIFSEQLVEGMILEIVVNEKFEIKIEGNWQTNTSSELKLNPDKEYTAFLKPVNLSKTSKDTTEAKNKKNDSLQFQLSGLVVSKAAGDSYNIQAQKSVVIDGKTVSVQLAGIVDSKSMKNNKVYSKNIANLNLIIQAKPAVDKDNSILMKQVPDANNVNQPQAELSEAEKQKYILEYLRQVIGNMNK